MLENFIFSISSALPIFLVMCVGYMLKCRKVIDEDFIKRANTLVFNVALPIKLFNEVFKTSFNDYFDLKFIIFIISCTLLSAIGTWLIGLLLIKDKSQLGAFIHGAFRGNFLYIGLSLMENITGSIGLKAPLVIAFVIPLYNILAVIILTYTNIDKNSNISAGRVLRNIASNPLIVAIVLGAIASQFGIKIPTFAIRTMSYFEALATPLALITIGASFSLGKATANLGASLLASLLKLVVIPLSTVSLAIFLGFNNEDVLLIYLLFGVPTATVSYIMTAAMNGDRDLSANIIMTTTILSNFTMTLFIFGFRTFGII